MNGAVERRVEVAAEERDKVLYFQNKEKIWFSAFQRIIIIFQIIDIQSQIVQMT